MNPAEKPGAFHPVSFHISICAARTATERLFALPAFFCRTSPSMPTWLYRRLTTNHDSWRSRAHELSRVRLINPSPFTSLPKSRLAPAENDRFGRKLEIEYINEAQIERVLRRVWTRRRPEGIRQHYFQPSASRTEEYANPAKTLRACQGGAK